MEESDESAAWLKQLLAAMEKVNQCAMQIPMAAGDSAKETALVNYTRAKAECDILATKLRLI